AHAELSRKVDARLDRDDVPGCERLIRGRARHARALMHLQADAMAEAVAELLAVAGPLDRRARHRVQLGSRGTGPNPAPGLPRHGAHELVDLPRPRGDPLAARVGARAV